MSSTVARASASAAAPAKKSPSEFLKSLVGRPVVVRLASGVDYRGILICLDGFMNVALEQAEEWVRLAGERCWLEEPLARAARLRSLRAMRSERARLRAIPRSGALLPVPSLRLPVG